MGEGDLRSILFIVGNIWKNRRSIANITYLEDTDNIVAKMGRTGSVVQSFAVIIIYTYRGCS